MLGLAKTAVVLKVIPGTTSEAEARVTAIGIGAMAKNTANASPCWVNCSISSIKWACKVLHRRYERLLWVIQAIHHRPKLDSSIGG